MSRILPGVAAGVLLALGLTACADDDPASGLPGPEDAQEGEQVDVDLFLEALEHSFADGATAAVAFDVEGATRVRGRGAVRYDEDGLEVDVRISDWQVEGGRVLLRTVDGSAYMLVPESRGLWVDIGDAEAGLADSVLVDADPRGQIELYRESISEVRFGGEETVRGETSRRYQVTTEPDPAGGTGVTEFWFDGEGRVIRRADEVDGGRASFSWLDWESPVEFSRPPERRVITLEELERLRREQSSRP